MQGNLTREDYAKGMEAPFWGMYTTFVKDGLWKQKVEFTAYKASSEMVAFYNEGDELSDETREAVHEFVKKRNPKDYQKKMLDSFLDTVCVCPECHAYIKKTEKECPVCGEEHEPIEKKKEKQAEAALISQLLSDKDTDLTLKGFIGKVDQYVNIKATESAGTKVPISSYSILEKLKSFPMPNEKQELISFMVYFIDRLADNGIRRTSLNDIFKSHLETCKRRARLTFPSDPDFAPIFAEIENVGKDIEEQKKEFNRNGAQAGYFLGILLGFMILIFLGVMADKNIGTLTFWIAAIAELFLGMWLMGRSKLLNGGSYKFFCVLAGLVPIALGLVAQNLAYMLGTVIVIIASVVLKKKLLS